MNLTENQKKAIAAIRQSLISFEIAYEQLENEDDGVDIDDILDKEFYYLSDNIDTCCEADVLKDDLFDMLATVEEIGYDEN